MCHKYHLHSCETFSGLIDQLAHLGEEEGNWTHAEMRQFLCFTFLQKSSLHKRLTDNSIAGARTYADKMSHDGGMPGDTVMLLTAATAFKRRIRVYQIFKAKHPVTNFNPVDGVQPKNGDLHLLEYSSQHFTNQVYMSLVKNENKRNSWPTEESPLESTAKNFSDADKSDNFSGISDDPDDAKDKKHMLRSCKATIKPSQLKARKEADYAF